MDYELALHHADETDRTWPRTEVGAIMQIAFDGKQFYGSYITGPTHNYLGLTLVPDLEADWSLEEKSRSGETRSLSPEDVREWISDGVAQGNAAVAANFGVARGEYVISDSVRPTVYAHIAKSMVAAAKRAIRLVLQTCLDVKAEPGVPIPSMIFLNIAKEAGHKSGDVADALEYCRSIGWIECGLGGAIILTDAGATQTGRFG
jgi:hypothetical protein